MKEEVLFRMNFILQDSAATTTTTYLGKMIESLIFVEKRGMSIDEIRELLFQQYVLEFSNDEIRESLNSLQKRGNRLIINSGKYVLTPEYEEKLRQQDTIESLLLNYCKQAINELKLEVKPKYLYTLVTKYVYHCFNTNEVVLKSLIDGKYEDSIESFKANNEEIAYINAFLYWENNEKNILIYKIISYCYIYCTLNTKKDVLLSRTIFKNKHFFLDANIIFRMAGINNDDRQTTVKSFVKKCDEVGILLSITSETVDEVYRVIRSKVGMIQGITHSSEPISLDLDSYGNDFYNIYIEWCRKPGNKYNDFNSFANYLENLVNEVMANLDYVDVSNLKFKNNSEFQGYANSLRTYKLQNLYKNQSTSSIETDVSNVIYVKSQRSARKGNSIFSTNTYIISADHNLINWYQKEASGVPLIVLPSIWLTIMLRYTGRSNDDYKSFVSFMGLRIHEANNDIDVFSVLKELGYHTSDKELKEKIVSEIITNKNRYLPNSNSSEEMVKMAFDIVKEKEQGELRAEFEQNLIEREKRIESENAKSIKLLAHREQASSANKMAFNDITKYKRIINNLVKIGYVLVFVILIVCLFAIILWAFEKPPVYIWVESWRPEKASFEGVLALFGTIWLIAEVLVGLVIKFLNYLVSENVIKKKMQKYINKYTKILVEDT